MTATRDGSTEGAHIAILNAYANRERDTAVFEVVMEEPTIEQHALLSLSPRAEAGEYIVKATAVGHARSTYGMHRAVAAVGEWVASLDAQIADIGAQTAGLRRVCYNAQLESWPRIHEAIAKAIT